MLNPGRLIQIDNLLNIPYRFFLFWFCRLRKNTTKETTEKVFIIKMMGIGSITRVYKTLREEEVDFDQVTFITLASNRGLFNALGIDNVKYIKDKNLINIGVGLIQMFFFIRMNKPSCLINFERASNLLGMFQLISVWFTQIRTISFHDFKNNIETSKDVIFTIHMKSFQDLVDLTLPSFKKMRGSQKPLMQKVIDNKKILININASNYMPYRKYPISSFKKIINTLHNWDNDLHFDLVGNALEKDYVESLMDTLDTSKISITNRCGEWSLVELLNQFSNCALFITNDSGPMHLASLVNIPMIVIWGPTSAQQFGYHNKMIVNIETKEACSPCFQYAKSVAAVSCNKRIDCLNGIAAVEIITEAKEILVGLELVREVNFITPKKKIIKNSYSLVS